VKCINQASKVRDPVYVWSVSTKPVKWEIMYWLGWYTSQIYMISHFTGLVDTHHTYTWSLTLLAWLIHFTHIHDLSLYWLGWYTSHIYMISHFTGLVDTLHTYTFSLTLLAWLIHFTNIHNLSLYWRSCICVMCINQTSKVRDHVYLWSVSTKPVKWEIMYICEVYQPSQ
jgi:hypothetical protein